MSEYTYKAHVSIEIVPVSPETTKDRILREQAQARLDLVAADIARSIEGRLQPMTYEEAVMGAVLLDMGRSSQPDAESVRRFEEAKRAVMENLERVFKDGTP